MSFKEFMKRMMERKDSFELSADSDPVLGSCDDCRLSRVNEPLTAAELLEVNERLLTALNEAKCYLADYICVLKEHGESPDDLIADLIRFENLVLSGGQSHE